MSKSIKIPSNMNPWVCIINGVVYSYEAGKTTTVPDDVADLIEAINALDPVPAPAAPKGSVWTLTDNGAAWVQPSAGAAVADAAGDAPTAAEYKALLDSLRNAGIIAK